VKKKKFKTMEKLIKSEIMRFFKLGGFQIRSDVAIILVNQLKNKPEAERKEFVNKIFINIQNQNIETNSIEENHITTAIKVITRTV
jgi:DNA polymerases epsilon N terminal